MWNNVVLLKRTANVLLAFSALAAFYGAVYYMAHLPGLLPVRSIHLAAAPQRVLAEEVLAVARNEVRGNFLTADIERLRLSLEKLSWVRHATIRREFPDTLAVHLEEHQALARWNNNALVNTHGEVFSAGSEQALPDFIGQTGDSEEVARYYNAFSQQLSVLNIQLTQIALSPRHAWQLRLSNGMVLELGREAMEQRLARFVAVYPYSLAEQASLVRYVDMRYRNGFAVGGIVKS